MRVLLLLIFAVALCAAEREQFTLKDGRVLIGSYDETSQTLAIESPKASMHVDVRDIVKREEAPPTPEPKKKAEVKPAAVVDDRPERAEFYAAQKRRDEAMKAIAAASEELGEAAARAREEFVKSLDLSPVPNQVPLNPTVSQLEIAQKVARFNEQVELVRSQQGQERSVSDSFLQMYAEVHGTPWILEVLQTPGRPLRSRHR